MELLLNPSSVNDYRIFLQIKGLPHYGFTGRTARIPDEYADRLGVDVAPPRVLTPKVWGKRFDYQQAIAEMAIRKGAFSIFADCGLGKTLMFLDFAYHALRCLPESQCVLIVSPLMVVSQTIAECERFYSVQFESDGESGAVSYLPIQRVEAHDLADWLNGCDGAGRIGITNYDALKQDTPRGRLGGLILDESSMLKSHYGKWGTKCLELGRGLHWKLACTGTPAPNDRIEYANHAVFMDAYPTVNSFMSRFFVNRGQTDNRWELKPHATEPFYRALSHWCIFLTNPATYGWKDNAENIPPINVEVHRVPMTDEQRDLTYEKTERLFADKLGGITSRSVLSQIAKGNHRGQSVPTNKPDFIRKMIESWSDESTIIWCKYNAEQELIARTFPDAANIAGATPIGEREQLIADFKAGRRKVLISKPKILGFGLNLERATRQVFSGLEDSYESFYQAVKRSNRYGSTRALNVHIPVTDIERPMIETVLAKAERVQEDTEIQERIFCDVRRQAL